MEGGLRFRQRSHNQTPDTKKRKDANDNILNTGQRQQHKT